MAVADPRRVRPPVVQRNLAEVGRRVADFERSLKRERAELTRLGGRIARDEVILRIRGMQTAARAAVEGTAAALTPGQRVALGDLLRQHELGVRRELTKFLVAARDARVPSAVVRADLAALLMDGAEPAGFAARYRGLSVRGLGGVKSLASDLRRIVVSEGFDIATAASVDTMLEAGETHAHWTLSARHRDRDICDDLAEGGPYRLDAWPARPHPNCILPGTLVSGRVQVAMRSDYDGECVRITTRHGLRLTLTQNHPVLTTAGWLPAQRLERGEQLVRSVEWDRAFVHPNVHERPVAIDQVFDALAESGQRARWHRSAEDFHGDARFGQGQIEVVWAEGELRDDDETVRGEDRGERFLVQPDVMLAQVVGPGSSVRDRRAVALAASGVVGGADLRADSGGVVAQPAPLQTRSIGRAAHRLTHAAESRRDGRATDAELFRQLQHAHPGAVALDQVVDVDRRPYRGHVYDLQTETGYMVAAGILISNCGCMPGTPFTPRRAASMVAGR